MNRQSKKRPNTARSRKRILTLAFSLLAVCIVIAAVVFVTQMGRMHVASAMPESQPIITAAPESVPEPQPVVTKVRFSASGDNLIHDGLYLMARKRTGGESYDFTPLYAKVADFYKDFDVNWINQETLVTDEIVPSGYPCFCSPTNVAQTLYNNGFRVFAGSNNHSYDQGAAGIAATRRFWATMPADTVFTGWYAMEEGAQNTITVQEVNGIKIAYLPYTEHTNGLPTPKNAEASIIYTSQTDVIEQQIKLARTLADVVIPCIHWGTENSHVVNDAQRTLGQQMADWGADFIIGTHPHVVQSIEFLTAAETGKTVPIVYSLGNFVSLQTPADNLIGIIATFDITKTTQPGGESEVAIDNVKATPVVMYYNSSYTEAELYLFRDYTDEIAARHANGNVTRAYVQKVLEENISPDILQLT